MVDQSSSVTLLLIIATRPTQRKFYNDSGRLMISIYDKILNYIQLDRWTPY